MDVPDRRQLEGISAFAIAPAMRLHKISLGRVVSLDSVLLPGAQALSLARENPGHRFNLEPSKYYDHNQLVFTLKNFVK